ncbi:hypothetical protein BDM02DRAFT_3089206 [Thelephora ganbajun]|uniref:Uncharacterized protein n=1 Tax=Thelephora ganbajun TaxID=370292 RepID=A0ACB6ZR72_THEGA|nr:hypothetical protein BDM02DRAFT_3089206 [Thelephora ganbajun]
MGSHPKQADIAIRPAINSSVQVKALDDDITASGRKRKPTTTKRRKVNHACLYCRRSHMTCDEGRPCQRCIKREIAHLCHDEQKPSVVAKEKASSTGASTTASTPTPAPESEPQAQSKPVLSAPEQQINAFPSFLYPPETTLGSEFSVLSDFLESLDERSFFNPPPTTVAPALMSAPPQPFPTTPQPTEPSPSSNMERYTNPDVTVTEVSPPAAAPIKEETVPVVLPSATKTEKFLMIAADQEPGPRNERLNRVIRSKYEAGLLKPYNYVKGYARLQRWMDSNVSQESKQKILQPLSVLRPKFRAIAQSLTDIDLVFIEEAFERLLLDYDRVFSAMAIPACLWRRTGEIYKGNREFAELVGLDSFMLRDGRSCIYELMAEESAVNYWEKYADVAFNVNQKAVLTTCVLKTKPRITSGSSSDSTDSQDEESSISCCFSFTIRRDAWGTPSMIVGNFIKC